MALHRASWMEKRKQKKQRKHHSTHTHTVQYVHHLRQPHWYKMRFLTMPLDEHAVGLRLRVPFDHWMLVVVFGQAVGRLRAS